MPKGRILTLKQKGFVDDIIKTKNPTKSAMLNYEIESKKNAPQVAYEIAKENLEKPLIKRAIEERLEGSNLRFDEVVKSFKRNITQSKELNVSQNAVDSYFKITGHLGSKDSNDSNVKIGIIIEK